MKLKRRQFLAGSVLSTAAFLQSCQSTPSPKKPRVSSAKNISRTTDNAVRFFASSGFAADFNRINLAVSRLQRAGFFIDNQNSSYRRYQRFAGTVNERAADFQDMVTGRVKMPKMLLGLRGGFGAGQILPAVDWRRLGAMMRERQTLLLGFSDVTAIQAALWAQGQMTSFCGPMLYSEFGNPNVADYTMRAFIDCVSRPEVTVAVNGSFLNKPVEGIFWGGNLSVLASLAGTPYMPKTEGGILFLEDAGEQPYRIERMLQTLYLAGILQRQKALVLGKFVMTGAIDQYDRNYDLNAITARLRSIIKIPVLNNFPFGHIHEKTTMPLGSPVRLTPTGSGFAARFSDYPYLNTAGLNLDSLLYSDDGEDTEEENNSDSETSAAEIFNQD